MPAPNTLQVTLSSQQVLAAVTAYLAQQGMEVRSMTHDVSGIFGNEINGVIATVVDKSASIPSEGGK